MTEKIVLGGGCFWCTEAVFQRVIGVVSVTSGYAGGGTPYPTYEQVSAGTTGHAEVVEVRFDPEKVSLMTILEIFFATHDPTTRDRQGADVGTQYRSVVYYVETTQRPVIDGAIARFNAEYYDGKIVTEVAELSVVYPAEEYHRDYFNRNQDQPYCSVVISPKLAKFREKFADKLRGV
jgi:peptide-methionine (S)-S-oxide reductase